MANKPKKEQENNSRPVTQLESLGISSLIMCILCVFILAIIYNIWRTFVGVKAVADGDYVTGTNILLTT